MKASEANIPRERLELLRLAPVLPAAEPIALIILDYNSSLI